MNSFAVALMIYFPVIDTIDIYHLTRALVNRGDDAGTSAIAPDRHFTAGMVGPPA
jgi:hypothetical protein